MNLNKNQNYHHPLKTRKTQIITALSCHSTRRKTLHVALKKIPRQYRFWWRDPAVCVSAAILLPLLRTVYASC
jgi:hypothetical protein